jgi:energy-coupling factor transporter ATP-binding protein EcfA2
MMINEDDISKPLSLNDDDDLRPSVNKNYDESSNDFVPIANNSNAEISNKDSNFIFFFGVSGSGKSVILSAMLYYLSSRAGVLRPRIGTPNSKEAQVLLTDFFENIRQGILPDRTTRDQVTRMDLVFEPNNKSRRVPPINLTFLETAGGNHQDITRGGTYHSSIEKYLNAKIPLSFIIVTSYDTAHRDDTLINEFLDELERKGNNLQSINVILVISKWDKSGRMDVSSEEELDNFISDRLPRTNNRLNSYELSKTYFTIGNITNAGQRERISLLNLSSAISFVNKIPEPMNVPSREEFISFA